MNTSTCLTWPRLNAQKDADHTREVHHPPSTPRSDQPYQLSEKSSLAQGDILRRRSPPRTNLQVFSPVESQGRRTPSASLADQTYLASSTAGAIEAAAYNISQPNSNIDNGEEGRYPRSWRVLAGTGQGVGIRNSRNCIPHGSNDESKKGRGDRYHNSSFRNHDDRVRREAERGHAREMRLEEFFGTLYDDNWRRVDAFIRATEVLKLREKTEVREVWTPAAALTEPSTRLPEVEAKQINRLMCRFRSCGLFCSTLIALAMYSVPHFSES